MQLNKLRILYERWRKNEKIVNHSWIEITEFSKERNRSSNDLSDEDVINKLSTLEDIPFNYYLDILTTRQKKVRKIFLLKTLSNVVKYKMHYKFWPR